MKTVYTMRELVDEYRATGTEPPEWLLRRAGMLSHEGADLAARMRAAGVPDAYATAQPDTLRAGRMRKDRMGYYVFGMSGDGKTTVASGIIAGWIASGMGAARWVNSVPLLAEIGDTYHGRGSEVALVGGYAGCGLLVIDDLGKEVPGEWSLSRLYWIIDERYSNRRPTVVTTQYGSTALAERLTSGGASRETAHAIVSRLRECCHGINCGDEDRRLANV